LIDEFGKGMQPVLIIDEAQNLSPEHLEEIRLLSNLETESAKLLQIILVGQPEIRTIIARPELRQLRQRISVSCHLDPLTRDEVEEYILHRMEKAGNRAAVSTSPEVFDAIHNYSRGIPRLVNIICDFLLVAAYAEETRELTLDLARDVLGDLDLDHRYWTDRVELPVDLAPEKLPPVDLLQQVLSQMQALEARMNAAPGGGPKLPDNLAEILQEKNRLLVTNIERISRDLGLIYKTVQQLQLDLDGLKLQLVEQKSRPAPPAQPVAPTRSQPGLLKRMFG
ncbi:AAA family ATPase, partial [Geoalkalibacter sp.]|uniref:AAA family ATPase n=1 Tax=Geoalkalibacter sp. TaxID=3041440 RepID=UPI00272E4312